MGQASQSCLLDQGLDCIEKRVGEKRGAGTVYAVIKPSSETPHNTSLDKQDSPTYLLMKLIMHVANGGREAVLIMTQCRNSSAPTPPHPALCPKTLERSSALESLLVPTTALLFNLTQCGWQERQQENVVQHAPDSEPAANTDGTEP